MIDICEQTDFLYPMKADVYYPIINQNSYGQATKDWVYDRTIVCNASPIGTLNEESIKPDIFLQNKNKLIARTKRDPRISSKDVGNAITNILITNIRDSNDSIIQIETAGARSGRGTIYEVATVDPVVGPFGSVDYFKMLWRRTENQTVGD
jgi:hypothetical protein